MTEEENMIEWLERYAAVTPTDQRRALYGRCCYDLVAFVKAHADEYDDLCALRDAADDHFRALLETTVDLLQNIARVELED